MHFSTRLRSTPSLVDLTPLVDVVFLLLIFFIITSDILPLKSLHIENPRLSSDAESLTTQLVIVVDAAQVIYVGSKKKIIALDEIERVLSEEIAYRQERHPTIPVTVVLSIDRSVPYDLVLPLFHRAQRAGAPLRLVFQPSEKETWSAST